MNTKKKLSLLLIAVLALSLALGTSAYYRKTFTSDNNKIRAARFVVSSNGTLDQNEVFDLTDDPIYPGIELEVYEFEIDKTGTEVPVEYEITVEPDGELFESVVDGDSPVALNLLRKTEDRWTDIGGLENVIVEPDKDIEKFRIDLAWEHSEYDIEYQGKSGKVKINVVATQVDGEPEKPVDKTALYEILAEVDALVEEDYTEESWAAFQAALADAKVMPEETQEEVDTKVAAIRKAMDLLEEKVEDEMPELTTWYFKWGASQYVVLEEIDIEDADTYQVTAGGVKLGNTAKIGKALIVSSRVPHPIKSYTLHVYGPKRSDGRLPDLLWEGEIKPPEFRGNFPPDPWK